MLKSLLVENYALIEKLDISFDDGLVIITGETGAGKSILLGALGLILGQRADTRALHNKQKKCIIEGVFSLKNLQLQSLFENNELDYEEITIFRREINPQGKSRAFINDTPVNLNVMKQIAEKLIDIHSQHESLFFGHPAFRYQVLDTYSGATSQAAAFREDYHQWQNQIHTLEKLREQEKNTRAELDYFQFLYDELHKAALQAQEVKEIETELEVLNNAGDIKFNLEKADFLLQGSPENILSSLNELVNILKPLARYNPQYAELFDRLNSTYIEVKDIGNELAGQKEDINDDPRRQQELQQRFDFIQKLLHKHNVQDVEELIRIREELRSKIEGFESLEHQIEHQNQLCMQQEAKLKELAQKLSDLRKKSIPSLEKEITGILKELGMPNGQFLVHQQPSTNLHANGQDFLEFLFTANKGSQPQEIARVASGGELSRLMLAVKSVISIKNLLPTIIFDEIDTGVSGEIGFKMGNILQKIAQNMQVISVTHLPQVAARGHKHFIVYKNTDRQHTQTFVKEVDASQRVEEIAKMLGGENPSAAVMQTAKELLNANSIHEN